MTYHILPVPCARWARALAAASSEDLSPAERAALAAHVADCPACSIVQREYRAMDERIFNLPHVAPLAHLPAPLYSLMEQQEPDDELGVYFVEGEEFISVQRPIPVTTYAFPQPTEAGRRRLYTLAISVMVIALLTFGTLSILPMQNFSQTASSGQKVTYKAQVQAQALYNVTLKGQIVSTSPTDGQVNWTTRIPGQNLTGAIAVSVYSNSMYIGTQHMIIAMDVQDQQQLWRSTINAVVNKSLETDKSGIYVGSSQGIYALSPDNGQQLWHFLQPGCSPCDGTVVTLAAGNVYSFSNGLYALNNATGKVLWYDNRFSSTNSHIVQDNGKLYVASTVTNQLYILRADTGQQLNTLAGTDVVAADGLVYVSTPKNGIYALRTSDDSTLWNGPMINMSVLAAGNGVVYSYSVMQTVPTITPPTPVETPWVSVTATATSSLNIVDQQVNPIFFQMQASDGSMNWKSPLPITIQSISRPLVIEGNLYMSTTAGLTAVSGENGTVLWQNGADQVLSNLVST